MAARARGRRRPAQRFVEPSIEFHEALGVCSNNEIVRLVIAVFGRELTWHVPGEQLSARDMEATRRVHRTIAQAVAAGDAERASKAMAGNLRKFERVLAANGRLDQPVMRPERWLSG